MTPPPLDVAGIAAGFLRAGARPSEVGRWLVLGAAKSGRIDERSPGVGLATLFPPVLWTVTSELTLADVNVTAPAFRGQVEAGMAQAARPPCPEAVAACNVAAVVTAVDGAAVENSPVDGGSDSGRRLQGGPTRLTVNTTQGVSSPFFAVGGFVGAAEDLAGPLAAVLTAANVQTALDASVAGGVGVVSIVTDANVEARPSASPSAAPSTEPSGSARPSTVPTSPPSDMPSAQPTSRPSSFPSRQPSGIPSVPPTTKPTNTPTNKPTSAAPSHAPSSKPTAEPTNLLSSLPTKRSTFKSIKSTKSSKTGKGKKGKSSNVKSSDGKSSNEQDSEFMSVKSAKSSKTAEEIIGESSRESTSVKSSKESRSEGKSFKAENSEV